MNSKKYIWPEGIKRTKQREILLDVLAASNKPLSAADIYAKMENSGDTPWMSTVYRSLDIFVKKGVVIKTAMLNSDMAVYELNRFQHKHYAVCMNCNRIIPMDNCPMEHFNPQLEDKDFQVMGHNLEVFGLCKNCKGAK